MRIATVTSFIATGSLHSLQWTKIAIATVGISIYGSVAAYAGHQIPVHKTYTPVLTNTSMSSNANTSIHSGNEGVSSTSPSTTPTVVPTSAEETSPTITPTTILRNSIPSVAVTTTRIVPTPTPVMNASAPSMTKLTASAMSLAFVKDYASTIATGNECVVNLSQSFSANGKGSVAITFYTISNMSETDMNDDNDINNSGSSTYTFTQAGSATDTWNNFQLLYLQPNDTYKVYAKITDTANLSVSVTSAPAYLTHCGTPNVMPSATAGTMTKITLGTPTIVYNTPDSLFHYMCSEEWTVPVSVDGSGTTELYWTLTSNKSGGGTFFTYNDVTSSNGPDTWTNTDWFRIANSYPGDTYTLVARMVNVANGSVIGTSAPITLSCNSNAAAY